MRRSRATVNLTFIVVILLIVPVLLLKILANDWVAAYCMAHLSAAPCEVFDSVVNYLSMGFALLLGVVVYYQEQKINDLESTEYDVFIGVEKLDDTYTFDHTLIRDTSRESDFYVVQSFSDGKRNFLVNLNTNLPSKEKTIFLPLSFVIKSRLVITSLDLKKINLIISMEDSGSMAYKQNFCSHADPIHGIFDSDSSFLLGIGMMVPASFQIDRIQLCMKVESYDQIGRVCSSEIQVTFKEVSNLYYLESSKSKTCRCG